MHFIRGGGLPSFTSVSFDNILTRLTSSNSAVVKSSKAWFQTSCPLLLSSTTSRIIRHTIRPPTSKHLSREWDAPFQRTPRKASCLCPCPCLCEINWKKSGIDLLWLIRATKQPLIVRSPKLFQTTICLLSPQIVVSSVSEPKTLLVLLAMYLYLSTKAR